MHNSPLLFGALIVSGFVDIALSAPGHLDCGNQGQVQVVLQPYEIICDGVTSTSTSTRTTIIPPPKFTDTPGSPGGGSTPDVPGNPDGPPAQLTRTVTVGCTGEGCAATTLPPPSGCTEDCTVTVVTTMTPPPSGSTKTVEGVCTEAKPCSPVTVPPPEGCTRSCITTVTTFPEPAPSSPPTGATTVPGICTEPPCDPVTVPPTAGCTQDCITTVTTFTTTSTVPPDGATTEFAVCTDAPCEPVTVPPAPDCTRPCTTTITTYTSTQTPDIPTDGVITVIGTCTETTACAPVTVPPASDCTRPCTTTVTTYPSSSPIPSDGTTIITGVCTESTSCPPVTVPPASDCTRPCTTTITTFPGPSPTTTPTGGITTVTGICTETACDPVTIPPSSGCTVSCTTTVSTYSTTSTPVSSSPIPSDGVTTVTGICTETACEPVTVPPASDCTRPCTTTVTSFSTPPPDGATTVTAVCTETACEPVTVPPASDCIRPCTTTVTTYTTPTPSSTPPAENEGCESTCDQDGTGLTVKYYPNAYNVGYGATSNKVTPDLSGQTPLGESTANNFGFPADPNYNFPDSEYQPGYTRNIYGITVNANNFTLEYTGYFQPTVSGNWTICQRADDINNLFIDSGSQSNCDGGGSDSGETAIATGYATGTVCGSRILQAGFLYPFRQVYGQIKGQSLLNVTLTPPGGQPQSSFPGSLYAADTECLGQAS